MNIANPLECYQNPGILAWLFKFGAYAETEVWVFGSNLEKALDDAAWWLKDNEPGHFTDESELQVDDDGNIIDHTMTEAGYIPSREWWVSEVDPNDLADKSLALLFTEDRIARPEFNRDDIMLAWYHYLSRRQSDQWSDANHLRLLRLQDHFTPYGLSVTLTGLPTANAAAIYGRLAAKETDHE